MGMLRPSATMNNGEKEKTKILYTPISFTFDFTLSVKLPFQLTLQEPALILEHFHHPNLEENQWQLRQG